MNYTVYEITIKNQDKANELHVQLVQSTLSHVVSWDWTGRTQVAVHVEDVETFFRMKKVYDESWDRK